MSLQELLKARRSIRKYTGEMISEEQLQLILDAAYLSPIGRGLYQNYRLSVVTDPALLNKIEKATAEFMGAPNAKPLYGAPMQIIVSAPETGTPGDKVTMASATCALQDMSLQAVELGIGNCLVWCATLALADSPEIIAKLGVPEGYVPCGSLILGVTEEKYEAREVEPGKIETIFLR